MAPGSATVVDVPVPEPELCAPSACEATPATPVHADIRIPPSDTDCERVACTTSIFSPLGNDPSGKFCTLVAT